MKMSPEQDDRGQCQLERLSQIGDGKARVVTRACGGWWCIGSQRARRWRRGARLGFKPSDSGSTGGQFWKPSGPNKTWAEQQPSVDRVMLVLRTHI